MTFQQFIKQLDAACVEKFGMNTEMMVDLPTRDWYDSYSYDLLVPEDEMEDILLEVAERNDFVFDPENSDG